MTDQELLELVENAAGYKINLTDDGDALRLAVKLRLSVCFEERNNHEWSHIVWVGSCFEPLQGDNNAATRRAIFRAAAKIGKQANTGIDLHLSREEAE